MQLTESRPGKEQRRWPVWRTLVDISPSRFSRRQTRCARKYQAQGPCHSKTSRKQHPFVVSPLCLFGLPRSGIRGRDGVTAGSNDRPGFAYERPPEPDDNAAIPNEYAPVPNCLPSRTVGRAPDNVDRSPKHRLGVAAADRITPGSERRTPSTGGQVRRSDARPRAELSGYPRRDGQLSKEHGTARWVNAELDPVFFRDGGG
jgi:hypothetical protein